MAYEFETEDVAARDQLLLRALFMGPTGSGKSRAALEIASRIFEGKLGTVLINTEQRRAKLYADRYEFALIDMSVLGDFSPEAFIAALDMAEERWPGRTIILDSVSHEWTGAGGILQQADRFGDWKIVRPKHNAFVERIGAVNSHVIATCRAKMKYEVGEEEQNGRKRQVIRMLGVGPIQSDDLQYEFNLVGRFEQDTHDVSWSGHVDPLTDTVSNLGDEEQAAAVSEALTEWLSKGNPPPAPPEAASEEAVAELVASLVSEGNPRINEQSITETFAKAKRLARGVLTPEYVAEQLGKSKARIEEKKAAAAETPAAEAPAETSAEPASATKD
jgi:hypothetical protein